MSAAYEPVVGLEVHVQLGTATKMFCGCRNVYGEPPNTVTCPVCLGLPGALPVANREAFALAIRFGLALGARIAPVVRFERKHYFYPDLPKGYQISQSALPIVGEGALPLPSGRAIRIQRAHLEEDAGKGLHGGPPPATLIDLNRCGIPLLEIVSAPEIRSPGEAREYLDELKLLLRHLAVSECDMEKGSLRCDVNVSVRPAGSERLGVRAEIKNLNSFKAVERALDHEIARHVAILTSGGRLVPETRLWDEDRGETRLMRRKEESEDYRYFPDPDLPPCTVDPAWIAEVRATLPELPAARRRRYEEALGLSAYDAGVLVQDPEVAAFFDAAAAACGDAKAAANWITADLFGLLRARNRGIADLRISAAALADLIRMVKEGAVNVPSGRRVLERMVDEGGAPAAIAQALGLAQISDRDGVRKLVLDAIAAHPQAAADLRAGKERARGALVGAVMRASAGRANPALVQELLRELL